MIIKHIRGSKNWDAPGEFVVQANAYTIQNMDDERLLVMAQDGQGAAFEVFKDGGDELYIMNDNGRTIDSYAWPKPVSEIDDDFQHKVEASIVHAAREKGLI